MKLDEKESLIHSMGMKYDEAAELFSDETLSSMAMSHVIGGDTQTYCSGAQCVSGCQGQCDNCSSGGTGTGSSAGSGTDTGSTSSSSGTGNAGTGSNTGTGNGNASGNGNGSGSNNKTQSGLCIG